MYLQFYFFTFGIGTAVNRHLLEGMAHIGKGIPFVATNRDEAQLLAGKFLQYVSSPVLTNIRLRSEGSDIYDIEPMEAPDLFSERPLMVFGKYQGKPAGFFEISGKTGTSDFIQRILIHDYRPEPTNAALQQLWARERIRLLGDYSNLASNASLAGEITAMGLKYNLLTAYTSFVAIDSETVNEKGTLITINQPLPLPRGVSNYAVGMVSKRGGSMKVRSSYHDQTMLTGESSILETMEEQDYETDNGMVMPSVSPKPEFNPGGESIQVFIRRNLIYPSLAKQEEIEGTVYAELLIDEQGKIYNITIIKGVHPLLDAEALRVLGLTTGKWKAAIRQNKVMKSTVIIPVPFVL